MDKNNKSRILAILDILHEYTDEDHSVSITEIMEILGRQGINAHRRTIMTDIDSIEESGVDVITIKSTQNRYFIGKREFELAEIKLLVDAVESSVNVNEKVYHSLMNLFTTTLTN